MLTPFKNHIQNKLPFLKEGKLLVAISGGLDSVVLTHLCHALKLNIALAHCNFNLRGESSNADEQFVIDLADKLDLEVFVQNFDTEVFAKTHTLSTQMAARQLRYDWFKALATRLKFDYILTAHHADDNLETFLINLSRGTGLEGLTGIPEANENLVRPMLPFSRETIEAYAQTHKIIWREDDSNASDKYLRNALRHHVVPKLKGLNSQLLQNFENTTRYLKDAQGILDDRIDVVSEAVLSEDVDGNLIFDVVKLKALPNPKAYLFQLLKDYGFTAWNDVEQLLDAQSGKYITSSMYRLVKNRNELILSFITDNKIRSITINASEKKVTLPQGVLFFDEADAIFGTRTDIVFVDKDLLKFPLTVRPWKEGDYFYPKGMTGKKKLSKFFKDEKLSLLDKENTLLLCSDDAIVWIINQRADNRYKVTNTTKHILKITYTR